MDTRSQKKGFTLIELMVVISIISLLSVIVLTSLQAARQKARDSKRVSLVTQYTTALELYKLDHGYYPPIGNTTTQYCVGYNDNNSGDCQISKSGNINLYVALLPYYPSEPALTDKVPFGTFDISGLVYDCETLDSSNNCISYKFQWYAETPYCGPGGTPAPGVSPIGCTVTQ